MTRELKRSPATLCTNSSPMKHGLQNNLQPINRNPSVLESTTLQNTEFQITISKAIKVNLIDNYKWKKEREKNKKCGHPNQTI